ncbi:MAG: sodium:proton antiporter [Bacteroidetes bacterium HGW-Bacteroidetes-2]|nr:MAG: sodium:proton antiporter [Bacteroidetes bacterium HGW-Bacteroidetes-2]
MEIPLIITLCTLLLLAYIFDVSSSKTKIPSVILLLILGWAVKAIAVFFKISIPDLKPILPILGTIGIILIVLEGSLEVEIKKAKLPFIGESFILSFLPILIISFTLAWAFHYFGNVSLKTGLANAIPFSIISSAIAIPSVKNFVAKDKEFVTYETSLSDILGIFFNFIVLNGKIGSDTIGLFFLELLLILIVSFIASIGLAFLMGKIRHNVKFAPIILIIVLIYAVSKIYHLPALLFILLFGLFIGNLEEFKGNKFIHRFQPEILNKEVFKFKELTSEVTFLIRTLFFLLFGYFIEIKELLNPETIIWAASITLGIFLLRLLLLLLFKISLLPLLFIAPRGLITILLYLSIPLSLKSDIMNDSLIIQVIVMTTLMMMFGLMTTKKIDIKEP